MNKKNSTVTQAADPLGGCAPTQPFCQKDDEKISFIPSEATNKNESAKHFVEISGLKIEV